LNTQPIFIVGTERSGSNLLRLILNAHSRIAIPHPPHILNYFQPIEATYGDLARAHAFSRLVDDILRLISVHIHPWEIRVQRDRILREAWPRNTFGVFCAIYDQFLDATGKARWGCKSTFMIEHAPCIVERYPEARFVWLIRDPRDVAASARRSVFGPCHPWLTARLWAHQQRLGLALEEQRSSHLIRIHYEELITGTKAVLSRICAFLGEDLESDMFHFDRTQEARRCSALSACWRNTGTGMLSHNAGKFITDLTSRETALVEHTAAPVMRSLGYRPVTLDPVPSPPSGLSLLRLRMLEGIWRLGVEVRSLRQDRNVFLRWLRRATVESIYERQRFRRLVKGLFHPRPAQKACGRGNRRPSP